MEEKLKKIVDLINSRQTKDQFIGKQMVSHLTLSEAWIVCNNTIKARNMMDVKFLFDIFDPRTYPVKRNKHILDWEQMKRWVNECPDQLAVPRHERTYDLKEDEDYLVLKRAPNPQKHLHYQSVIIAQTGGFVKVTGDYWIFDTFRVGKRTLMSIEPARK